MTAPEKKEEQARPLDEARALLEEYLRRYFLKRDLEGALALMSEHVHGVGVTSRELALGKVEMRAMMGRQMGLMPDPIPYEMVRCVQQPVRGESCGFFCELWVHMKLPRRPGGKCKVWLTAELRREEGVWLIQTLHVSEPDQSGSCFPMWLLSEEDKDINGKVQRELLEIVEQVMPGGVIGGYAEKDYPLYVANNRLLRMAGYDSYQQLEEHIGGLVINSIHPKDRAYVEETVAQALSKGDQYEIEYRMLRQDGSYFWVHDIGRKAVSASGRNVIISVLIDISEQVNIRKYLKQEAELDPLTGIYNRKAGTERIEQALKECPHYLFIMIDLDNFKQINDNYGHQQGD